MQIILPEIVSAGIYNTDVAVKNRTVTKIRKTAMFEIEIPIKKGGVSHINSVSMPIDENLIICSKPGQLRKTKLPYMCYYIHIIVKSGDLTDMLCSLPDFIITDKHEKYVALFQKICRYYESNIDQDEIMLHSLILELIHTIHRESKKGGFKNKTKSNNRKAIESTIVYIKEHLSDDLSLEALAKYSNFSPIHFHKCFKASTGKTLRDYVEEQRIKKASNLLLTTNLTLTQIAYDCGFSSQSYFSYAFKRRMKITPREYAKQVFTQYETE